MKSGATYFKYSVILIGIILVFLLFRRCGSGDKQITNDTLKVKIDTFYLPSKTDTFYKPSIVKTEYKKDTLWKTDTLESTEYLPIDTAEILKDYFATRYYEDEIPVEYGKVIIHDTITTNMIAGRGVKTDLKIPVIEKTITVTMPPKNIFYVGFGAMGSQQNFLEQTKVSFGFKAKNDKYYGFEGALSREGNVLAGFEVKIPIRLTKK